MMTFFSKTKSLLFTGFLAGALTASIGFTLLKSSSYEECVLKNLPDAHSDQAARMVHVVCKRLNEKPKYVFEN